jgi:hypothetical protein
MPPLLAQIKPNWPQGIGSTYPFLNVDGGTLDNEPIELARIELAGLLGRNKREGIEANRAVVLVDPFPDPASLGPESDQGVIKTTLGLVEAWIAQSRFKPVDLALAREATVYSRFLVTPSRGNGSTVSNGFALASGALGGFSGFLHREFRKHDYLLGRRNCQQFLRKHFTLPAANPLFAGWSQALKTDPKYLVKNPVGVDELPIIPLVGDLNPDAGNPEGLPTWPTGQFDTGKYDQLRGLITNRLDCVYDVAVRNLPWYVRLYLGAGWAFGGRSKIVDFAIDSITQALRERNL